MINETLRLYKTAKQARIARAAYIRHNRSVSTVFKHRIIDKRVKDNVRYALIINCQNVNI